MTPGLDQKKLMSCNESNKENYSNNKTNRQSIRSLRIFFFAVLLS